MPHWTSIVAYLGDAAVMLPAAMAIVAWLAACGAWKIAITWTLAFSTACLLVAGSKVIYMAWGWHVPSLAFNALSGHAMLSAAILPMAGYMLMNALRADRRTAGGLGGAVASVGMGVFLVFFEYHSVSETVGGWLAGAAAAFAVLRRRPSISNASAARWRSLGGVLVFVLMWHAEPGVAKLWIVQTALHLSGKESPYE
ncbi:MAG TPA: hypothetical protein VIM12_20920 [Noviherbaspirillum sp.]|uniref:hypothetical protein n=1 Tax=Noviherbaspirillum sp. TaxID=1926288 RepID=UPI002F9435E8